MGSRLTKVTVSPHVKAVASPVAPIQNHHERSNDTNGSGPCQDHEFQPASRILISPKPCDDLNLESSVPTNTLRRRYSEPSRMAAMATELNSDGIQHLVAFESYITERDMMAIDVVHENFASLGSSVPVEEKVKDPGIPEVQCLACCTELPEEKAANHATEVIKPCRSCNSAYCVSCVRAMFLNACKDSTRMPPRCCMQIHLHHIKPHLTPEEVGEYKSKYEEWSTPKPFYCPTSTCSAFIPERLLPQQKVDSGVGLPNSPIFQCQKCKSKICIDCRQAAHPDSLCATLDLGVDADTAALLKAWGYKRCPKCSQGLKRMYGCNHMECRCGAHFCWGCMKSRDECEGGCYEDEDEDEDEDDGSDTEPGEPDTMSANENDAPNEALALRMIDIDAAGIDPSAQVNEHDETAGHTTRPISRLRNLDGGPARYWEEQDLDFGEEPTDDVQDIAWDCHHSFQPYTISLTDAISTPHITSDIECVKCWCTVKPNIETPPPAKSASGTSKAPRVPGRGRGGRRGRGRGTVARLRPAAYVPPRGLVRSDATIGTAPHLTTQFPNIIARPAATRSDPMEGIKSSLGAAFEAAGSVSNNELSPMATSADTNSKVFSDPSTMYIEAHECRQCSLLVCRNCADAILANQEAREIEEIAEEKTQPEETRERREVQTPSDYDEQPFPSQLD